ncbi:MAG: DUF4249 family protein [Bacteroidales bacterium]|nr:DUF4249 family protein [Bacteroidales bacterium]
MIKNIVCFFAPIFITTACSTEVDIDYPAYETKIVVDGSIESGRRPEVFLTYSSPYFTDIDSSDFLDLTIFKAKVSVIGSNGDNEIMILQNKDNLFPRHVYTTIHLKGVPRVSYLLVIELGGNVVTAQTTIPQPVKLDSIWFVKESAADTTGYVWVTLSDSPSEKNYYRVSTKG